MLGGGGACSAARTVKIDRSMYPAHPHVGQTALLIFSFRAVAIDSLEASVKFMPVTFESSLLHVFDDVFADASLVSIDGSDVFPVILESFNARAKNGVLSLNRLLEKKGEDVFLATLQAS